MFKESIRNAANTTPLMKRRGILEARKNKVRIKINPNIRKSHLSGDGHNPNKILPILIGTGYFEDFGEMRTAEKQITYTRKRHQRNWCLFFWVSFI
jgi:hypothetical protein